MEHEHPHTTGPGGPTGPTFDTLAASEALKDAGFSDKQAKAVTHTIVAAQDNLASKADIRELRAEMKAEFKAQRADMAGLRADNKRVLDAFEAHVKALRADNKRVEETLKTEIKSLKESVDSLKTLVMYVALPLVMGATLISLTVFGFVVTRAMFG